MELLLVRHGLPIRRELEEGVADPELSESGLRQAVHLAQYLSSEQIDAVYSSPLQRARQTAAPVAASRGMEVRIEAGIAEFDQNSPEYIPVEELKAANDPRWVAMRDGTWDSDESEVEFRERTIGSIESIIERHPGGRGRRRLPRRRDQPLPWARTRAGARGPADSSIRTTRRSTGSRRRRAANGRSSPSTRPATCVARASPWVCSRTAENVSNHAPDQLDDLIDFLDASPSPVARGRIDDRSTRRIRPARRARRVGRDSRRRATSCGRRRSSRGGCHTARRIRPRRSGWSAATPIPRACRVKPRPDAGILGWKQLAVEVYGGILNNSWLDRDLGVAGRLIAADGTATLVNVAEPIARVPQLAVHLDRDVNGVGLLLDTQQHLSPVWGVGFPNVGDFASWIAGRAGPRRRRPSWWELSLYDVQGSVGARCGRFTPVVRSARQPALVLGGGHGTGRPPSPPTTWR